jgi:peptide-methionine (R)-S-oxide reductase
MRYNVITALVGIFAIAAIAIAVSRSDTGASDISAADAPPTVKVIVADERFDGQPVERSEAEWKKLLTAKQFYILREKGTEYPFTGELDKNKREGIYRCAACKLAVFHSKAKFDSGTGWPSFYEPIFSENVAEEVDRSLGEIRIEVHCPRCGGHLGHVFDDGPKPTGLRYCINSDAMTFSAAK